MQSSKGILMFIPLYGETHFTLKVDNCGLGGFFPPYHSWQFMLSIWSSQLSISFINHHLRYFTGISICLTTETQQSLKQCDSISVTVNQNLQLQSQFILLFASGVTASRLPFQLHLWPQPDKLTSVKRMEYLY